MYRRSHVSAVAHLSVYSHAHPQLSWVCTCGGIVAAQCPVMDEGGGGDFPRGRLAPGSYDLSRALLSFCWAPLQSHSLQRLLSQGWGQGLSNVCVCRGVAGWTPSSRETLMPEPRVLRSCEEEDQVVIHLLGHNSAPRGNTVCDGMGQGFIHSFIWQTIQVPTRRVLSFHGTHHCWRKVGL